MLDLIELQLEYLQKPDKDYKGADRNNIIDVREKSTGSIDIAENEIIDIFFSQ